MTIEHDFSDFPKALYDFAVEQMTWREILAFDSTEQQISKSSEPSEGSELAF